MVFFLMAVQDWIYPHGQRKCLKTNAARNSGASGQRFTAILFTVAGGRRAQKKYWRLFM